MTTRQEALDKMVAWMQDQNLPLETLREVARDCRAIPPTGAGDQETANLVAVAVRRVVRLRVEAELATKTDAELRVIAAQLTNAQGNYADELVGPAQSDALVTLAAARHPQEAATVEAWEQATNVGIEDAIGRAGRRYALLGVFDYYATTDELS